MIQGGSSTDLLQCCRCMIRCSFLQDCICVRCVFEQVNGAAVSFVSALSLKKQTTKAIHSCRDATENRDRLQDQSQLAVFQLFSLCDDKHGVHNGVFDVLCLENIKSIKPWQSLSQHRRLYLWRKINFMISTRDQTIDRPARCSSLFLAS